MLKGLTDSSFTPGIGIFGVFGVGIQRKPRTGQTARYQGAPVSVAHVPRVRCSGRRSRGRDALGAAGKTPTLPLAAALDGF